MTKPLFPF